MLTPEAVITSDHSNSTSQETFPTQLSRSIRSSFIYDDNEEKSTHQGNKRKIPVFNSWQNRDKDKLSYGIHSASDFKMVKEALAVMRYKYLRHSHAKSNISHQGQVYPSYIIYECKLHKNCHARVSYLSSLFRTSLLSKTNIISFFKQR